MVFVPTTLYRAAPGSVGRAFRRAVNRRGAGQEIDTCAASSWRAAADSILSGARRATSQRPVGPHRPRPPGHLGRVDPGRDRVLTADGQRRVGGQTPLDQRHAIGPRSTWSTAVPRRPTVRPPASTASPVTGRSAEPSRCSRTSMRAADPGCAPAPPSPDRGNSPVQVHRTLSRRSDPADLVGGGRRCPDRGGPLRGHPEGL